MKLYAEIQKSYHDPEYVRISTVIWLSTGEDEGILLSKLSWVVEGDLDLPDSPEVVEATVQIRNALQVLRIAEKRVPAITGVTYG